MLLLVAAQTMLSDQHPGRAGAEDVVQQAFIAAWEKIQRFEYQGEGSFRRWLTTIVVNEARGLLRRENAERRNLPREPGAASQVMGGVISPEQEQPSQLFRAKEDRERFLRFLERLPDDELEVLFHRQFKNRSWPVVATETGRSEWACKQLYQQAFRSMGRFMQDGGQHSGNASA